VLTPGIDMATAGGGKVRLVYELGAEYDEYSVGATWEDMKLWTPHLRSWERCAVVTNHRMLGDAVRAFAMLMPGDVKVFPVAEREAALAWAAAD